MTLHTFKTLHKQRKIELLNLKHVKPVPFRSCSPHSSRKNTLCIIQTPTVPVPDMMPD